MKNLSLDSSDLSALTSSIPGFADTYSVGMQAIEKFQKEEGDVVKEAALAACVEWWDKNKDRYEAIIEGLSQDPPQILQGFQLAASLQELINRHLEKFCIGKNIVATVGIDDLVLFIRLIIDPGFLELRGKKRGKRAQELNGKFCYEYLLDDSNRQAYFEVIAGSVLNRFTFNSISGLIRDSFREYEPS